MLPGKTPLWTNGSELPQTVAHARDCFSCLADFLLFPGFSYFSYCSYFSYFSSLPGLSCLLGFWGFLPGFSGCEQPWL